MTLNLHNSLWVNFMNHALVIISHNVMKERPIEDMNRTKTMNFFSDLELTQMTFDHNHDTPSGHEQYVCKVRTFNISPKKYKSDRNYALFRLVILDFLKWRWIIINANLQTTSNICVACKLRNQNFRNKKDEDLTRFVIFYLYRCYY